MLPVLGKGAWRIIALGRLEVGRPGRLKSLARLQEALELLSGRLRCRLLSGLPVILPRWKMRLLRLSVYLMRRLEGLSGLPVHLLSRSLGLFLLWLLSRLLGLSRLSLLSRLLGLFLMFLLRLPLSLSWLYLLSRLLELSGMLG
ncbi:MAG: hypothetical protein LBQ79_10635 [Deltaproteobacteria bacterium]|jgi:hypothetical protein|nr:hypothetical protein [Deltaproteobacteria bacterium]